MGPINSFPRKCLLSWQRQQADSASEKVSPPSNKGLFFGAPSTTGDPGNWKLNFFKLFKSSNLALELTFLGRLFLGGKKEASLQNGKQLTILFHARASNFKRKDPSKRPNLFTGKRAFSGASLPNHFGIWRGLKLQGKNSSLNISGLHQLGLPPLSGKQVRNMDNIRVLLGGLGHTFFKRPHAPPSSKRGALFWKDKLGRATK